MCSLLIVFAVLALVKSEAVAAPNPIPSRRPNLLVLMADHAGADLVAPQSQCRKPNLDRLAAEGFRFARCYTPTGMCSPARASLMTATYASTHGVWDCTHTQRPEWQQSYGEFFGQRFMFTQRIVWHGDWKYIFSPGGVDELYDLADDRHERTNLATNPAHRARLVEMVELMWQTMARIGDESLLNSDYLTLRTAPIGPDSVRKQKSTQIRTGKPTKEDQPRKTK